MTDPTITLTREDALEACAALYAIADERGDELLERILDELGVPVDDDAAHPEWVAVTARADGLRAERV